MITSAADVMPVLVDLADAVPAMPDTEIRRLAPVLAKLAAYADPAEAFRAAFVAAERSAPAVRDNLLRAVMATLRSVNPEQMSALSTWEPTETPPTSPPGTGA